MNLAKQYNREELKKLQQVEKEILEDFIKVCNDNNLDYFVIWGSLIGAIRHEGFIPWDDDLDVGMFREDYTKLEEIFDKELGNKYVLTTPVRVKGYSGGVIKIMKKNTTFIPDFGIKMKCFQGIYIDIFVYDKIEENRNKAKKRVFKARFLSQLMFLNGSPYPVIPYKGIKKFLATLICKSVYIFLLPFPSSKAMFFRLFTKLSESENRGNSNMVTCFQGEQPLRNIYNKQDYFPLLERKFENIQVKVPNHYDKLLTDTYGDYMKIPSIEDRINHRASMIEFYKS